MNKAILKQEICDELKLRFNIDELNFNNNSKQYFAALTHNKKFIELIDKIKLFSDNKYKTISECIYNVFYEVENICYCGRLTRYLDFNRGYAMYCSIKCASSHVLIKDKIRNTCFIKYGMHPSKLESTKEKSRNTSISKYGCESPNSNGIVKENKKQSCLDKYGVENPFQIVTIKSKIQNLYKEKYLDELFSMQHIEPLFTKEEYSGTRNDKNGRYSIKYKFKCKICSYIFEDYLYDGHRPICVKCNPSYVNNRSKYENVINDFLLQYVPYTILNKSGLLNGRQHIDIFIPGKNIGIEFNGLYWHSELNGKYRNYHLNKTNAANTNGIQLIHIFEDEWMNKQEIVKSILKNKLGICEQKIFARKCIIRAVKDYKQFLNNNHIQGEIGTNINIGLYYDSELVSMISIGKSRFSSKYEYEIYRFCNKLNTVVVGGFSRLLKYFIDNYNPKSIVTYADARWSTGELYKKNGFTLSHLSKPDYSYIKNNLIDRLNRQKFQRKHLPKLLENFDESLTEWENMQLNGYDRIWDCGNYCYVKEM